jgi:hypothetical protein
VVPGTGDNLDRGTRVGMFGRHRDAVGELCRRCPSGSAACPPSVDEVSSPDRSPPDLWVIFHIQRGVPRSPCRGGQSKETEVMYEDRNA